MSAVLTAVRRARPAPDVADQLVTRLNLDVPDLGQRAYLLATTEHETGARYTPVTERYNGVAYQYFERKYGYQTTVGRALGNEHEGDGYRFRGRGLSQLTGRDNYLRFTRLVVEPHPELGNIFTRDAPITPLLDLVARPDEALHPEVAYRILLIGVLLGEFTGLRLDQFVFDKRRDYRNARKTVNGLDRADDVAALARTWERALQEAA